MKRSSAKIIELKVRNHAGVLSHIAGLFSRRGFNLEAVFCAPVGRGLASRMYLLLRDDARLAQVVSQLRKLYDVQEVFLRTDCGERLFKRLHCLLR